MLSFFASHNYYCCFGAAHDHFDHCCSYEGRRRSRATALMESNLPHALAIPMVVICFPSITMLTCYSVTFSERHCRHRRDTQWLAIYYQ